MQLKCNALFRKIFENFFTEFSTIKNPSIFADLTNTEIVITKSIRKISIFDSVSNSTNIFVKQPTLAFRNLTFGVKAIVFRKMHFRFD